MKNRAGGLNNLILSLSTNLRGFDLTLEQLERYKQRVTLLANKTVEEIRKAMLDTFPLPEGDLDITELSKVYGSLLFLGLFFSRIPANLNYSKSGLPYWWVTIDKPSSHKNIDPLDNLLPERFRNQRPDYAPSYRISINEGKALQD